MAERAMCRFHCSNCETELEQEGYIAIYSSETELVEKLLTLNINKEICPNCNHANILPLPLFFQDGENELLVCYLAGADQMTQEDITEALRYPYEAVILKVAADEGIEFPEPDAAAFPRGEEQLYSAFSALTQEQAAELLPEYLLRPTVVNGLEVMVAMLQAVREGMGTQDVLDDMARLQLINEIIGSQEDPIARRKVFRHNEPYLDEELYEVIDTLKEQMVEENNTDMVEKLTFVRTEIERYKTAMAEKAAKAKAKRADQTPSEE